MSKNTNLSFLTDYITADITNGRIGINNASPTVAFDVSGATKISGVLTLTGALTGTSATFTGLITAQSGITFNTTQTINTSGTIGFNSTQGLFIYTKTGSSYDFKMYNGVGSTFMQVPTGTQNVEFLGTATFSSSVTATYASLSQAGSATAITQIARFANTTTSTANGSGAGFDFALNDATGSGKQTGQIASVWSDNSANDVADLAFYTRPSGAGISEKLRITGNGNVGIGTTTPDQILSVRKTSAGAETIALSLQNIGGTAGTAVSMVFCPHETSATPEPLAKISAIRTTQSGALTDLVFYTFITPGGLTERMRILSSGQITVNHATTNTDVAYFTNGSASPYGMNITFTGAAPNNTTNNFIYLADTSGLKCRIVSNGSIYNSTGTYGSISDIKLKENIVDTTPKLEDLLKVKVRNYNLIGDDLKQIGVVAQELETVFPSMVENIFDKETNETTKSVKYSIFVPMLIKSIQEQQTQIEELKTLLKV